MSRRTAAALLAAILALLLTSGAAGAQGSGGLSIVTDFPSQAIGVGDSLTLPLTIRSQSVAQVVRLDALGLPDGWTATFRNGNRVVLSAYVEPGDGTPVDLRIETSRDAEPGDYTVRVRAQGDSDVAVLPITLRIENRLPPSLAFESNLPVLRGKPDATLRYNVTLHNEGGEDLVVELSAAAPPFYRVLFKRSGQEITSLPLTADQSESLSVELDPLFSGIPAGRYVVTLFARGGAAEAAIDLQAEIVGESDLSLTTPDGRLSGRVLAASENPIALVLQNNGTAPAHEIEFSATEPTGWKVVFEPDRVETIGPGETVEVTARVTPSDKALAGDYMLTFRAQPSADAPSSVEYRATVRTSTLWGVVGVVLIAVAVAVLGLAVARYGRR